MTDIISFGEAYSWLNRYPDYERSKIGVAVSKMIDEMRKACKEQKYQIAWDFVYRIPEACDQYGQIQEAAEARVACACMAYRLGNLRKTAELLKDSIPMFRPSLHDRGVALWMLGYILWQIPGQGDEAIKKWRESIDCFITIVNDKRYLTKEYIEWYQIHILKMVASLKQAIEDRGIAALIIVDCSCKDVKEEKSPPSESKKEISPEGGGGGGTQPFHFPEQGQSVQKPKRKEELFANLLLKAGGNEKTVKSLIKYEKTRNPNASIEELLRNAIERWEKDNR